MTGRGNRRDAECQALVNDSGKTLCYLRVPPEIRELTGGHDRDNLFRLGIVVCFQNEVRFLPTFLESLAAQEEPADEIVLVDDGSTDGSTEMADAFARAHENVILVKRPVRNEARDRLADAPELRAFDDGLTHLRGAWDAVAKMDADLKLSSSLFADVRRAFRNDPQLGVTGSDLTIITRDGAIQREHNPPYHVRGPNKFYRRGCYEAIRPLPTFLGWDTVDDLRARAAGWTTRSFVGTVGETFHLRPTGSHDGRLRAYRRWGRCAWGYGAHPAWVFVGGLRRSLQPPILLCGVSYWLGWINAAATRAPRAEPAIIRYCHQEDLVRMTRTAQSLISFRIVRRKATVDPEDGS